MYGFGTSRALAWMDRIRGPSRQIHREHTPDKCLRPRYLCQKAKLPSAGVKVRGTYLKISAKKDRNWKRAAEHRVLATIRYYATKLPLNQCACSYSGTPCPKIIISLKCSKTYILSTTQCDSSRNLFHIHCYIHVHALLFLC